MVEGVEGVEVEGGESVLSEEKLFTVTLLELILLTV